MYIVPLDLPCASYRRIVTIFTAGNHNLVVFVYREPALRSQWKAEGGLDFPLEVMPSFRALLMLGRTTPP